MVQVTVISAIVGVPLVLPFLPRPRPAASAPPAQAKRSAAGATNEFSTRRGGA